MTRKRITTPSATITDVARRAGVSKATVSRALNAMAIVAPATREAVALAARELGYLPSAAARSLASHRSHLIGAVVPTLDNPIFANCLEGMQRVLKAAGYTLLLSTSDYEAARELEVVRTFVERGAEAVMLVGGARDPALYDLLDQHGVPFCVTWTIDPAGAANFVGFDNAAASASVMRHLYELGHRRFGTVAGITAGNDRATARLQGLRDFATAHGCALAVSEQPYTVVHGAAGLRDLMPARPTAVICANDIQAIGAMTEARKLGLRVPDDLSITGFDDMEIAACMVPPLTTVHIAAAEIGAVAARNLLRQIADKHDSHATIATELIVRGSTGPCPVAGAERP